MPSKERPSASTDSSLESFVSGIVGDDALRVEEDLGYGFVRLKSSEAERRQAAQDIRCSEDIVLEMLRNSRDANARNVFLATGREGQCRSIIVIDDGDGIPHDMHESVFQPRVTSKLDSARLDKWGMHGRGMALYSISQNASYASVQRSSPGLGSSIRVVTDTSKLPERADQSTFPTFERTESGYSMRGPRNILRTACEFAFEHRRDIQVYCASDTEIVATLYSLGAISIPASERLFGKAPEDVPITQELSFALDERMLAEGASLLGIDISDRSARRILDGEIAPAQSLMQRMESESFGTREAADANAEMPSGRSKRKPNARSTRISAEDLEALAEGVEEEFGSLAQKYYLESIEPRARQHGSKVVVEFDIIEKNS